MQKYQEIESDWDYKLFDCDKNCPMCLLALIPGVGILMQAYNAEASDPANPNACPTACLCGVIFCCIGSIYNSYNLAKNLHLKHSWVENIVISLLFCLDSCSNTQEWMQTMHKVKGNHKMSLSDLVLVAEFHQTEGAIINVQYPSSHSEYLSLRNLAPYLLTEGLHNHNQDTNIFILRERKESKTTSISSHPKFWRLSKIEHSVDLYKFDQELQEWKLKSNDDGNGCILKVRKEEDLWYIDVYQAGKIIESIKIHQDLQYTALDSNFASLYTEEGEAVGIFFKRDTQEELEELLHYEEALNDEIGGNNVQIPAEQTEITYGISVVMIKQSDSYVRGAKTISIGVCTKQRHFYCYRNLLLVALEMIFSEEYSQEEIAMQVYNSLNNANWDKLPILSEEESRIAKWLYYKQLSEKFTNEIIETTFFDRKMYFEIDCTLEASEIMPVSFFPLLSIFKEKTMSLYDALIRGKRIILFSKNKPAWEVCTLACALTQLACPPLINISELHLHPYAHLNNLDFLNSQFFIAGVTNPLFKIRPQWWDVFGDLDTGEIISHLPPPLDIDINFISSILENLPSEHNKESYIRSQFFDYTQNIIDLAIFEEDFQEKGSKLQRARDWRSSIEFEYYSNHYKGKIFADEREPQYLIYKLLTRIRIAFAREKIKGIRKMYYELDTLLSSRDECLKFLSMLPNNGDLHCLTCTFFLDNDLKISRVACSILAKLEEIPEGKELVLALPQNELNSYLAYRHRHAI